MGARAESSILRARKHTINTNHTRCICSCSYNQGINMKLEITEVYTTTTHEVDFDTATEITSFLIEGI